MNYHSLDNCEINFILFESVELGDFKIDCANDCIIKMDSDLVSFNSFTVDGSKTYTEINSKKLETNTIDINISEGRV